jgi:hypothetical protein
MRETGGHDWEWTFEIDTPEETIAAFVNQFSSLPSGTRLFTVKDTGLFPIVLNYQAIRSVSVKKVTVRRRVNA